MRSARTRYYLTDEEGTGRVGSGSACVWQRSSEVRIAHRLGLGSSSDLQVDASIHSGNFDLRAEDRIEVADLDLSSLSALLPPPPSSSAITFE